MLFDDYVEDNFSAKVKTIAASLSMNPDHIMAVMGFETRMTFSPSVRNPLSTATGLVQFMASTATGLGTSTAALAGMSAVQQLDYVEDYFVMQKKTYGALNTLVDTYLSVFYPKAIKWASTERFPDSVYQVNRVFDTAKKGYITKQDVADTIAAFVKKNGGSITDYNQTFNTVTIVGIAVMAYYAWHKWHKRH